MTGRFFRREISWNAYGDATGVIPPSFGGGRIGPIEAQYNIAPSQMAPVFRISRPGLHIGDYVPNGRVMVQPAFWGLVPVWWDRPLSEKTFSTFNARAETLEESRTFSGAWRHGRCLVPASGFYAWSGPKGAATPFAVGLSDRDWFCFAGLWSRAMIDGSEVDTFAIVTCSPNDVMAGLSTSMPVILRREHHERWLEGSDRQRLALLKPYPAAEMRAWPANPAVGNVRNQGPELPGE